SSTVVTQVEHELSALLAERDRIVNALSELDFDHDLGKIPEADYPPQRKQIVRCGAEVLRQIDQHPDAAVGDGTRVRSKPAAASSSPGRGDELEALIAARRRAQQDRRGGFCSKCGAPVTESDRFCPKCGASLS
ncbi:MAG: zinc ribbon domain-containing protein, partial [Chloroflexota bacterium]|nr:zinc ribbon domain-containing protein [Chloroflexota bacterium]